jgi:hypothetical protein
VSCHADQTGTAAETSRSEAALIPNPIRKVFSSMRAHCVRALLMGGQACVFYGAAKFSRDTDLAFVTDGSDCFPL